MLRRALPYLALALLAALAAWVLWPSDRAGQDAHGAEQNSDSAASGSLAVKAEAEGSGPAGAEREEIFAPAPVAEQAPEYAAPYEGEDALTIEVFDTTTGKLAPGAAVYYADRGLWDEATRKSVYEVEDTWTGIALRAGVKYRCGPDGTVRVPPRTGHATIAAEVEGRRGATGTGRMPDGRTETLRVEVRPIRSLTARVLRPDGAPAPDCTVAFVKLQGSGQWVQAKSTRTDSEGIARFDYLEEQPLGRGGSRPHLLVAEVLAEPLRTEIQPSDWPNQTIEFTLPVTGEVAVQVVDGEEQAVSGGGLSLSILREKERADLSANDWRIYHAGTGGDRPIDEAGRARFPYVSPGVPLKMQLGATKDFDAVAAEADRVARAGEVVELTMRSGPAASYVSARVLDPQGQPRTGARLVADIYTGKDGQNRAYGSWVTCDDRGVLRLRLRPAQLPPGEDLWLGVAENSAILPSVARLHRIPVPMHLGPGDHHLGDLVLGGRVVAEGIVVDAEGAPVADAHLSLVAPGQEWNQRLAYVQTAADGRFLFDCETPPGRVLLRVQPQEPLRDREIDVQHGDRELRIVLTGDTGLAGQVLLPPGARGNLLQVHALSDDKSWQNQAWDHDGDGAFRFGEVPPDTDFTLTVTSWNEAEPLFEGRYRLSPGEQAAPAELNPLDLREVLHYHRLSVLYEDGSMPPSCSVEVYLPDGTRRLNGRSNSNLFETVTTAAALDAVAMAPGCRPKVVTLRGSTEVRLSQGLRGTVEADIPPLPEGMVLVLNFSGMAEVGREFPALTSQELVLRQSGTQEIHLPAAGSYRVRVTLQPAHRMGKQILVTVPPAAASFDFDAGANYRLVLPTDAFEPATDEGG